MTAPDPRRIADLHLHTTMSDGNLTPTALVKMVADADLGAAAITDHDSTEGLDEAFLEAAKHPDLWLIPGIEISADHPFDDKGDLHMLGYFFDYKDPLFQSILLQFREDRASRGRLTVERLQQLNILIEWERVVEIADGASIGRPHIAQAMVEQGYIANVQEAFNGYLDDAGVAYISRPRISAHASVEMIHRVGGVAVLAHPLYAKDYKTVLPLLAEFGVAGFEVHYGDFSFSERDELFRLAEKLDMLPCGGSDYHAFGKDDESLPGSVGPPIEVAVELRKRAENISRQL